MSLEQQIQQLTKAVIDLTAVILNQSLLQAQTTNVVTAPLVSDIQEPVAEPVKPQVETPQVIEQVQEAAEVTQIVSEPVAPSAEPLASNGLPFNDPDSLVKWVVVQYQSMSPAAQGLFPKLLTHFQVSELSQLDPSVYKVFYDSVEALKQK